MKIAVLCGGISAEREVSLSSGMAAAKAITELGHEVIVLDPALGKDCLINQSDVSVSTTPPTLNFHSQSIIDCIESNHFQGVELVFILLHGTYGEDGLIQSLLDLKQIPYSGSGVKASAIAMDKITSKLLFLSMGIATPEWVVVNRESAEDYDFIADIRSELGNHLVIKPNDQGSAVGVQIVKSGNLDDIKMAFEQALQYSDKVLVEKFIEGRELTVGILGGEPLPVIEIIPHEGFYDYANKYQKGNTEYICPADLSEDISEFAQMMAQTAFQVLGCQVMGRADFRLNSDNQLFILEMNTIPGFTELSLLPKAAGVHGLDFKQLCQRIIELTLEKRK